MQLLYLDNVNCNGFPMPRRRPAACTWTTEKMRQREHIEENSGGFGLGEMQPFYIQEQEVLSLCGQELSKEPAANEKDSHQNTLEVQNYIKQILSLLGTFTSAHGHNQ